MKHSIKQITCRGLAAVMLITTVGCATRMGQDFDESKISQIKKGQTIETDLIEMFGAPSARSVNSEGTTMLSWQYNEVNISGKFFIPIVGPFMGGPDTKTKMLNVHLGSDGKVTSFTSSGGGRGEMRHGLQGLGRNQFKFTHGTVCLRVGIASN